MTVVGPNGAARFDYHRKYRLAVGADSTVNLHLVTPAAANVDLSAYSSFVGAGRRERNEDLTLTPLFTITPTETSGPGAGIDGLLTLDIDGDELEQDTPMRGYIDVFGVTSLGAKALLVTGRFECEGGTVDPSFPVPA